MEKPKVLKWFKRDSQPNRSDLLNPKRWLLDLLSNNKSVIGININEDQAMRQSAVYACVRILAETIASLPLNVYERIKNGKLKKIEHPLHEIIHARPNEYMSSFSWRETVMATILLRGNSVNDLSFNGRGDVVRIFPYRYDRIKIEIKDGRVVYTYKDEKNQTVELESDNVFHIPGLSFNGIVGISPIEYAKEAVAYAVALEQFGELFFKNRTNVGGVAQHPGRLSEQGSKNLRQSLNAQYAGLGASHSLMLLEEDMKYIPITIAPADAQYLELRKFQIEEIARIYRVPLHLLGELERSTNNNIEHQGIDFVVHSLRPWLVRIEQAINNRLFKEKDRGKYIAEFVVDGLLRGDTKSRWEAYSKAIQNGVYCPNDVLELENKNPYDGGDKHFIALNMQPIEMIEKILADKTRQLTIKGDEARLIPQKEVEEKRSMQLRSANTKLKIARAYTGLFEQMAIRILKREKRDVLSIAKKAFASRDAQLFNETIDLYYQDLKSFISEQARPIQASYADAVAVEACEEAGIKNNMKYPKFLESYRESFVASYCKRNSQELKEAAFKALSKNETTYEAIEEILEIWEKKKPNELALEEVVKLSGAVSKLIYGMAGIMLLRWINTGDPSCGFCQSLHDKVIGIESYFVCQGEEITPSEDKKMRVGSNKSHPPLHKYCQCMIVAES